MSVHLQWRKPVQLDDGIQEVEFGAPGYPDPEVWYGELEIEGLPQPSLVTWIDGKLLARCVVDGAIRGEPSTGRLLVALGEDDAAQLVANARNTVRMLAERELAERKAPSREIVLEVPDIEAQNAQLASLTGTEPQPRTWADDPEDRLAQQLGAMTGVRK